MTTTQLFYSVIFLMGLIVLYQLAIVVTLLVYKA